jgi:tetratricopeptide (TPR) repeat protein
MVAQARGQYDVAASAFARAFAHTTPDDQTDLRYRVLALLAQSERQQGNAVTAIAHLKDALTAARTIGNTWDTASIAAMLGALVRQQRHGAEATRYYMEALTLFRRFGSPSFSALCLEGYAAVLADEERQAECTRLCAASATLRAQAQTPAPPAEQAAVEALLADARDRLGEAAFAEAWRAGAALSRDAAIAEALTEGARRLSAEASPDDATAPDEC